jgi:tripartite-type tricarboxylate transporter receptor subunit TctC
VRTAGRQLLQLAVVALAALAVLQPAHALDYPTRTVRLVVGFPPGGSADIVARLVAQALTERMGQTFHRQQARSRQQSRSGDGRARGA